MTTENVKQLTQAADNALRLLDQIAKLEAFELSPVARELVRDASAPLRHALQACTLARVPASSVSPAVSRSVWAEFTNGTRNQITVHVADAATDADAVAEARCYFTSHERKLTRSLFVVIHREDGTDSDALPFTLPTDWAR